LRNDFVASIRVLQRNDPLRRVFFCIIAASLCLSMMSKTLLYWFKYAVENEAAAGIALATAAGVLILVAPVWALIAKRWSKRNAWRLGCLVAAIGYCAFLVLPMRSPTIIYLTIAFISLGTASFAVMFWAMLPDTVEYDEWLSGERHEAKVFGFASFAQKLALGGNAFLLGVLLDLIGFVPDTQQSTETLLGLKAIMTLVPLTGTLFTLWILKDYRIDAAFHRRITRELSDRKLHTPMGADHGS
jgi:GPH family glycoside/pentoside/hexuronide:cation symporter